MKEISDKLAAINPSVSGKGKAVTLLGSLPKSYEGLVTVSETRVDELPLHFVIRCLINAEQEKKWHQQQFQTLKVCSVNLKIKEIH